MKDKLCLVGGEALPSTIQAALSKVFEQVINVYGPAETVIWSSYYLIDSQTGVARASCIGKPLANEQLYVLDQNKQPVPIGVIGELYIGGSGLARGYLNRPELTQERFIENPFATESDKQLGRTRLYKTGDLVRWLADGNLEYIGRNDFQVKIRGYRIELGEIESVLTSHPLISQACVLARSRGSESDQLSSVNDHYLVGYYVLSSTDQPILESELLAYLSDQLPEYMLPSFLLALESFPLTVNGKLDRNALPAPDVSELNKDSYVGPGDEQEAELCRMWSEVLGLGFDQVSIVVDFFRLGGNSILAIQLSHKLSKYFAVQISVADVFKYKTVKSLSEYLSHQTGDFKLVTAYHKIIKDNLPNLIFIHPGNGGSEVYQDIADQLRNQFNCIGINNHNVYFENKITSLSELAKYYLSEYEKDYVLKEPIYLCGWSLGGQIALEMAAQLEQSGHRNISVILLDTILPDKKLNALRSKINHSELKKKIKKDLNNTYGKDYAGKVIAAYDMQIKLASCNISSQLTKTKVILYKAMQIDNRINNPQFLEMSKYIVEQLESNNLQTIAENYLTIPIESHHEHIINIISLHSIIDIKNRKII